MGGSGSCGLWALEDLAAEPPDVQAHSGEFHAVVAEAIDLIWRGREIPGGDGVKGGSSLTKHDHHRSIHRAQFLLLFDV